MNVCRAYGPTSQPSRSPCSVRNCSSRHSAPAARLILSVTAYVTSKCRLISRWRFVPTSKEVGDAGPSDALTVSLMNSSVSCIPSEPLRSQLKPAEVKPRTPPTSDASRAVPPIRGVKPPGNISWNEKQFGSSNTCCSATGSGDVVGDGHGRAVGGALAGRRERVANQQRAAAVDAEDAEPRVRIPEEEALLVTVLPA